MEINLKSKKNKVSRTKKRIINKCKAGKAGKSGKANKTKCYHGNGGSMGSDTNKPETVATLLIFYPGLIIVNGIDLTGKDKFYKDAPTVMINNAKEKHIYMVTMTDPDAPNGKDATDNYRFIHWVYIQIQSKKQKVVFVPYAPPSPPKGIHRYQFNLYDITNKTFDTNPKNISSVDLSNLRASKEEMKKTDFRKTYNNKLTSFLELKFKLLFTSEYKVISKDMLEQMKINKKILPQQTQLSNHNLQTQIQQQQTQINQMKTQQSGRPGFKTLVAANLLTQGIFNILL